MCLWGAGTVQMYYYFTKYTKDETWLKIHVFVVYALDTAHQALVIKANYTYLVTEYGNSAYLVHVESALLNSIILTAFICTGVQIIFLMRIWRLSKRNIYMTGIVALLVSGQFLSTVVYYGKAYHFQTFADLETIFTITRIINVLTAASDIVVAAALVYLLHSSRTGFKASDTMISRLIAFTVNTGLITAICAIASLVTGIVYPTTLIYILFYLSLSRLYMNSLFATLNSRENIRSGVADASSEVGMNSFSLSRLRGAPPPRSNDHRMVNIKVNTETIQDSDSYGKERISIDGRTPSENDLEEGLSGKTSHAI
ncbi:hypothetical protein EW145_g2551 [Phellinidium pouzarii]|uniref:DUF6534 domain-containing protein n=1 Tax=Phellinidium pouzarii TaxID=167371 RepID=A0A4S4LCD3_9AGAM|nr:hypothetical protein EW145_g2551 [Phellinidium pouzarii]